MAGSVLAKVLFVTYVVVGIAFASRWIYLGSKAKRTAVHSSIYLGAFPFLFDTAFGLPRTIRPELLLAGMITVLLGAGLSFYWDV